MPPVLDTHPHSPVAGGLLRSLSFWTALAAATLAPAWGGAKPPWAWGFLLSLFCLLAVLALLGEVLAGRERRRLPALLSGPPAFFSWPLLALLLWASCLWGRAVYDPPPNGLSGPALAAPVLAFAWAFCAAFLIGLHGGARTARLLRLLSWVWAGCLLLASWSLAGWAAGWPAEFFGQATNFGRPSGPFINANRFAVHLSMGLFAGLALLGFLWAWPPGGKRGRGIRGQTGRLVCPRIPRVWIVMGGTFLIFVALCATVSRLTILAAGAALGVWGTLAWLRRRRARNSGTDKTSCLSPNSVRGTFLRVALTVALLSGLTGVVLSAAHALTRHELASRVLDLSGELDPDLSGRVGVWKLGWKLVGEAPLAGHGPGSFENAFRLVQPLGPTTRWCEAHNDWLQVAIELGLVGLGLLVVGAAAWFALWWQALRRSRRRFVFYLALPAGLGLAVPAFCSLADFPLREPATGILYFLLLGALTSYVARRLASAQGRPRSSPGRALCLVLSWALMLPCLLAALYAARVGWATARSPWPWRVYPPPPAAGQVSAYREAASLALGYKPLQIAYGEALVMRIQEGQDPAGDYAELAGLLEHLRRLDPREYLTWVLEAHALGRLGEPLAAAEASDEAVRLAPCYLDVRLLAFHMHLICVRNSGTDRTSCLSPNSAAERERHLEAAFDQMRRILEARGEFEAQLFADLGGAGVLPDEALRHWPGREPPTVLARARYLARCRAWPKLAKELAEAPPEAKAEAWYEALLGQCLVAGGDEEAGLQAWARALRKLRDKEQPAARAWLHGAIPQLAPAALAGWVSREAADIAEDQALSLCVAQRLAEGRQWSQADRLLGLVAAKRPSREVYRAWAEAARQLGDVQEARHRARLAWDLSDKSADWGRWLDSFEKRAP